MLSGPDISPDITACQTKTNIESSKTFFLSSKGLSRHWKGWGDKMKLKHPVFQFLKLHLLDFIIITSPCLGQVEAEIERGSKKEKNS
jgi:hypothetical protein